MSISTSIQSFDSKNFSDVLNCYGIIVKGKYNYHGFNDLYNLYKLNTMFSSSPWGDIVDRSGNTKYPFKLHIRNKWKKPNVNTANIDLETACNNRVEEIISQHLPPYNIYWSGGIDSTLVLISFMKRVNYKDIIVHHTIGSVIENQYFYENIIKPNLLTNIEFNPLTAKGTNISGDCGDTIWAALDNSFFHTTPIKEYVYKPWQHWFKKKINDTDFMNFAEKFMSTAGRPIITLLDARWWFYLLCKSQNKATLPYYIHYDSSLNLVPFYESTEIETWAWHNLENIIKKDQWNTYKWPAKEIIYKFDKNKDYYQYKCKENSATLDLTYSKQVKKIIVNIPLFITENLEKPLLSTSPFFSSSVYKMELYEKYKHLFVVEDSGIEPLTS